MEMVNFAYIFVIPLAFIVFLVSKSPVPLRRKINTRIL